MTGLVARASQSWRAGTPKITPAVDLIAMPPSLWPADPGFVAEWVEGRFALAGSSIAFNEARPFSLPQAPRAWQEALLGFGWLRHVPARLDPPGVERLQTILRAWLQPNVATSTTANAVRPRRVVSWLTHADGLLQHADAALYDRVLAALLADVGTLERGWRAIAARDQRLLALVALAQASLCIRGVKPLKRSAEAELEAEIPRRQEPLHPDLRSPDVIAALMLDLEALRLVYKNRLLPVPPFLTAALVTFGTTLTGLMLGDGTMARLGTRRADPDLRLTVAAVRRHIGLPPTAALVAAAPLPGHDPSAGACRLALGSTVAVVDTGAPRSSVGALGVELTSGHAPLLIDDGLGTPGGSTGRGTLLVTASFGGAGMPHDAAPPRLEATANVAMTVAAGCQRLDATHAGWADSGFVHRRQLTLEHEGDVLAGCDELRPLVGLAVPAPADLRFAVRFVLHPSVTAVLADDHASLTLFNGHRWRLSAPGHAIAVEGCLVQDGLRTVPSLQLLVLAPPGTSRSVTWQLRRNDDRNGAVSAVQE